MNQPQEIAAPVAKAASAWAAVGIMSWSDLAAFLAAIYSACLLAEWIWKRGLGDFMRSRGWIK